MKLHYCFLKKFNNYFNRKIIMFSSLEDYQNASEEFFIPLISANYAPFDFNPNDNVTTEIIANDVPFTPDYILIFNSDGDIVSRWFILEERRNRQGQWTYSLKRDVISDHIDTLYDAPIFVQKGMLPEDDPFIVNSEGMSLNQIKKSETRLYDHSGTAWIVGYMAKNSGGQDIPIQANSEKLIQNYTTLEQIEEDLGIESGTLAQLVNFDGEESVVGKAISNYSFEMKIRGMGAYIPFVALVIDFDYLMTPYAHSNNTSAGGGDLLRTLKEYPAGKPNLPVFVEQNLYPAFLTAFNNNKASLLAQMKSILGRDYIITESQLTSLMQRQGEVIKYNGKFYTLSFTNTSRQRVSADDVIASGYSALTAIKNEVISAYPDDVEASPDDTYTWISSEGQGFYLKLEYISNSEVIPQVSTIISSGRKQTMDQEYDIFAIPLNVGVDGIIGLTDELTARRIAAAIGLKLDAQLYDLQLLPYCPLQDIITDFELLDVSNMIEHEDYELIEENISATKLETFYDDDFTKTTSGGVVTATGTFPLPSPAGSTVTLEYFDIYEDLEEVLISSSVTISGNDVVITLTYPETFTQSWNVSVYYHNTQETNPVGIMFYVPMSSFEFSINQRLRVNESKKIVSNCYMWRLVSPNYQGAFEFNLAKNGGEVKYFNVFCTYKPYTPFIKVAPYFEYLYGNEYKDNRGLICGGDYSLPRINSAWESYQLQNKNYQNIFNRDIQHMEFMQSIEMRNQLVSGAVGILADTAKGAGAGAIVGGPVRAVVGGVLGGATSAIGYGIDVDTLARTQRENKQLAIDKFNYQLGNIKALPYTMTKVGAFDAISKIFPFIEEYCCSDKELEAFNKKIQYESMTVMRIGTLSEFMNFNGELNYFKGELIRNDDIADDPHTLNAIYEELLKGVYI